MATRLNEGGVASGPVAGGVDHARHLQHPGRLLCVAVQVAYRDEAAARRVGMKCLWGMDSSLFGEGRQRRGAHPACAVDGVSSSTAHTKKHTTPLSPCERRREALPAEALPAKPPLPAVVGMALGQRARRDWETEASVVRKTVLHARGGWHTRS